MKQSSIFSFVGDACLRHGTDVVDLFCGIGGFSCGAVAAGHRVVLAVDADEKLLGCHARNHPHSRHVCTQLPDELPLPTSGRWHLHGSPPCQKLSIMQSVPDAVELDEAVDLVSWFLCLVLRARPTTWSMEEVNHERVRAILADFTRRHPLLCEWAPFNAADYGVPQLRKRIIAGSPVCLCPALSACRLLRDCAQCPVHLRRRRPRPPPRTF